MPVPPAAPPSPTAPSPHPPRHRLLLFTKPPAAGRVKTRLIGDLTAEQAAELHAAFLDDLLARLRPGRFELVLAWALEPGEELPSGPLPALRQRGRGLGERLHGALADAAREAAVVAAVGSDHPTLDLERVHRAFAAVETGAQVVLGPAEDGGYYLIALAASAVSRRLFAGIPWSTGRVLAATLERCRELDLRVELLPAAADVDTPEDLARLATCLAREGGGDGAAAAGNPGGASGPSCPRTRALLARWQRLPAGAAGPAAAPGEAPIAASAGSRGRGGGVIAVGKPVEKRIGR
ncbi:MAG TPA: TIGR04282 family arsenosugar biosynthesis glycosyltransferase [Thermoanaerobaculia bacterium]|nr:TIGR04282 family arsenosugar biosynthesis glycosyltransferase [Thermoanaerobaculia bacterium]